MSVEMERLERAWAAAANGPDMAAGLFLTDSLLAAVARQQLKFRLQMGLAGMVLGGFSLVAAYSIAARGMDPSREMGTLLMLALSWCLYALVLRRGWQAGDGAGEAGSSLPGHLRDLLAQNQAAMQRLRIMAGIAPLFLIAMGIAVAQLGQTGKMSAGNIRDFALLAGLAVTLSVGLNAWRYVRRLKPEERRLRGLLAQYDESPR